MSTSLNEYFTGRVFHWMSTSLNEYFTEWVLHWMSTSLNEYFTEWVVHWICNSLNEYLPRTFPLRLWSCNMQAALWNEKLLNKPSLASCAVFSTTSHFTCYDIAERERQHYQSIIPVVDCACTVHERFHKCCFKMLNYHKNTYTLKPLDQSLGQYFLIIDKNDKI